MQPSGNTCKWIVAVINCCQIPEGGGGVNSHIVYRENNQQEKTRVDKIQYDDHDGNVFIKI